MKEHEKILAVKMLELASENFSNHCCNDVDEKVYRSWTPEERKQFVKEYHEWNGDPEEYDENFLYLPDFAIMDFLAYKLKNEYNEYNK